MQNLRNVNFGSHKSLSLSYHFQRRFGRVDPAKIEAIINWERPKNVTEIRSFAGFNGLL